MMTPRRPLGARLALVACLLAPRAVRAQAAPSATPNLESDAASAQRPSGSGEELAQQLARANVSSAPAGPLLSLDRALRTARSMHPALSQARANTRASEARTSEAFAPLLPQLVGQASYSRATANYVPKAGQYVPPMPPPENSTSHPFWSFGLTLNQLVYDFGQTSGRWRAAQASEDAQRLTERATAISVSLTVRTAYFEACAQKALRDVALATLADQDHHLELIQGFVQVGSRALFDLAQARSARQSALLSSVNAQNAYRLAKVQLTQAMGLEGSSAFEVSGDTLPPVPEEEAGAERLFARALAARPDLKAAIAAVRADELTARAASGGYGPSLGLLAGLNEQGTTLDDLRWNWNGQATVTWQLFQGGLTRAQVAEADANSNAARAQVQLLRLQLMVMVEQARIGISGAKQSLATATNLVENTREQLRLAEGRYETGAGPLIDLEDAQAALQEALGQQIQAEFSLATARAQLLAVLAVP